MELLDNLSFHPDAMSNAFKEAMRKKAARGGNAATHIDMTRLPIGLEIVANRKKMRKP